MGVGVGSGGFYYGSGSPYYSGGYPGYNSGGYGWNSPYYGSSWYGSRSSPAYTNSYGWNSPYSTGGWSGTNYGWNSPYSTGAWSGTNYGGSTAGSYPYSYPQASTAWQSTGSMPTEDYYGTQSMPSAGRMGSMDRNVVIDVRVPADAEIWFENAKTQQTGMFREFISPTLDRGQDYVYHVRAHWMENGKPVDLNRDLHVRAGDQLRIDLMAEAARQGADATTEDRQTPRYGTDQPGAATDRPDEQRNRGGATDRLDQPRNQGGATDRIDQQRNRDRNFDRQGPGTDANPAPTGANPNATPRTNPTQSGSGGTSGTGRTNTPGENR